MDAIVAFLQARLDEDERIALGVSDGPRKPEEWIVKRSPYGKFPRDWTVDCSFGSVVVDGSFEDAGIHMARHDPARVLRAVEAKRSLISDLLAQEHFLNDREWYGCRAVTAGRGDEPDQPTGEPCTCGRDEDVERRLRLLASEWADHPDYRHEEWKP